MSEEADNGMHDVVKLLVARMKSHPQEFRGIRNPDALLTSGSAENRWNYLFLTVQEFANEKEKEALADGLRVVQLNDLHERVMDELLNGEERREQQRRAEEEKMRQWQQQQAMNAQKSRQALGVYGTAGSSGSGTAQGLASGVYTTSTSGVPYIPYGDNALSIADLMDKKLNEMDKAIQNTTDETALRKLMKKMKI